MQGGSCKTKIRPQLLFRDRPQTTCFSVSIPSVLSTGMNEITTDTNLTIGTPNEKDAPYLVYVIIAIQAQCVDISKTQVNIYTKKRNSVCVCVCSFGLKLFQNYWAYKHETSHN